MSDDPARRFAILYEDSYGAIHAYASRRAGAGAADEIAAETFLVAWRKFDDLPSEPLPWLYGVARNVVSRHHAAKGRQQQTRAALEHGAFGCVPMVRTQATRGYGTPGSSCAPLIVRSSRSWRGRSSRLPRPPAHSGAARRSSPCAFIAPGGD
jgi:hypothetical protein